jgi:hypothetical protein
MNIKQNILSILFISLITSIVLLIIGFTVFSISFEENRNFKRMCLDKSGEQFDLTEFIVAHQQSKWIEQFPYKQYSKSDNWKSPSNVESDLQALKKINENQFENQKVLSFALTTRLEQWNSNDLDSLNLMLYWVEQFKCHSCRGEESELLFATIHDYWLDFLAGKLKKLSAFNDTKYLFKYRYLKERCIQANHGIGEPNDNGTKIINYIIEKRWYYLFVERLWRSTGIWFRIFIISIIILTSYSYYRLLFNLFKH